MESDVKQTAVIYKLWAWGDKNKKQLFWGLVALVVVGIVVAFWLAHKSETQNDANYALSKLVSRSGGPSAAEPTADEYLKVVSDYPDTDAAQRALLLAAGDLFTQGKYEAAQAQFQKFVQQYNSSPLVSQAALGVAACLDAQGKTNDAVSAYDGVIGRYPSQNVVPQAKLSLARLQEAQGKFKEAKTAFEELTHSVGGTIGSEAAIRLQQLNATHPELQPTNTVNTLMPNVPGMVPVPAAPKAAVTPAPANPAPAAPPAVTPVPANPAPAAPQAVTPIPAKPTPATTNLKAP
jgi:predicted negative regulator of RcsB-dependent stress response